MPPATQAAQSFVDSVLARRVQPPKSVEPPFASQFAETEAPKSIRAAARDRGEVWRTLQLLKFSVAANILFAGLFLATSEIASRQPTQMIVTQGDLTEQMRAHLATPHVSKDRLIAFLLMTLPVRHGVTSNGAPFVTLLQGLMTADLYNQTAATIERNLDAIKAHHMSQSLLIGGVSDLDYDASIERLSAVVTGRLEIQAASTASGVPLAQSRPYRAMIVVDVLPISELNPYGFFIVSLREATNEAAVRDFDREMEARRERAIGK